MRAAALRLGEWLPQGDLAVFAWVAIINFAGSVALKATELDFSRAFPRDSTGLVLGRDFLNFWLYARAAVAPNPGQYYDVPHYADWVDQIVGGAYPWQVWSYPPTILLYAWPFHALPYLSALALWTMLSLATVVAALVYWRSDRTFLVAATLSPAAVFGLISGQLHLLIAAALFTAFRLLDRRPLIAGLLIGLLTVKPQVGLFLPVLLLAAGHYRVFLAAAATTVALAGLTTVIWGIEVWRAYIETGIASQMLVLHDPELLAGPFMPTLFVNLRFAGLGSNAAMLLQGVVALLVAGGIAAIFRGPKRTLTPVDLAIFFALSLIGSAYLNAYDTEPLAIAVLLVVATGADSRERIVLLLAYLLPPIQIVLGLAKLPGSILIPIALVVLLSLRRRGGQVAAGNVT